MEARAYFDNEIKSAICDELKKSSKNIYAAVAWFNDNDIFEIIKEKARNNVDVNIIIANDEINH
jgi:predicted transcriptional regulator